MVKKSSHDMYRAVVERAYEFPRSSSERRAWLVVSVFVKDSNTISGARRMAQREMSEVIKIRLGRLVDMVFDDLASLE